MQRTAQVRAQGTSLHCVRGGNGPAVILVRGFPEDWAEYQAIMPRLAKRFTVVALDLPGIGKSAPANGGYDAANLAAHIHALWDALKLDRPYVVGRPRRRCYLRLCSPLPRFPEGAMHWALGRLGVFIVAVAVGVCVAQVIR